jgi:hypothetical protein
MFTMKHPKPFIHDTHSPMHTAFKTAHKGSSSARAHAASGSGLRAQGLRFRMYNTNTPILMLALHVRRAYSTSAHPRVQTTQGQPGMKEGAADALGST